MTQDFITIASGALTARIALHGAELRSLTDADGREYMTDADPAFWTGHAPLLFPIVGGLNGGRYRHEGQEYALPRHGFARHSPFRLVEQSDDHARFRLADTDSKANRAVYPFAFLLDIDFRLTGATLAIEAIVANNGERALPFSFGYHPAFAWPLPGAEGDHAITFEQDEPGAVWRLDGDGLLASTEPSPIDNRRLALSPDLFEADAMIWRDLPSRSLRYGGETGPALAIAFPDTPDLGLWQKPGARFLCIEPWQGHADPVGFEGDIADKPGIVVLAPGEAHSMRMDVTVIK